MKGSQHLVLSTLTSIAMLAPFSGVVDCNLLCLIILGIAIGSLLPDADAARAAILSMPSRTLGYRGAPALELVVPLLGNIIKYFVYPPLSFALRLFCGRDYKDRHRGVLHSLPGALIVILLLILYLEILSGIAELHLGRPIPIPAVILAATLLVGFTMHLMQDSCTRAGIAWMYPMSSSRISGTLRTGAWDLRIELLLLSLGTTAAATVIAALHDMTSRSMLALFSGALLLSIWGAFLLSCGVRRAGHG